MHRLSPLLEAPEEHLSLLGPRCSRLSGIPFGESGSSMRQCGEGGAEPGQRSGFQSVSTRIAAQILESTFQGTARLDTGFRGPEQVVSPEAVEGEPSVPQTTRGT